MIVRKIGLNTSVETGLPTLDNNSKLTFAPLDHRSQRIIVQIQRRALFINTLIALASANRRLLRSNCDENIPENYSYLSGFRKVVDAYKDKRKPNSQDRKC